MYGRRIRVSSGNFECDKQVEGKKVRAEERAAMRVAESGEGGHWRSERRHMETIVPSNEVFEETQRRGCYRAWIPNLKLSDFVCGAPHVMGEEVARSRAHWNTRRRSRLEALEFVMKNPVCDDPVCCRHDVPHAGVHDLDYFGSLVEVDV